MRMVKAVGTRYGTLHRYKCTCGHAIDLAPGSSPPEEEPSGVLTAEGCTGFTEELLG